MTTKTASLGDAWLRLLRVPNLFTVPGDPLAGFMLAWAAGFHAEAWRAVLAAAAGICIYAFGLITNDLFDLEVDRRERAERPLPSARIRPAVALHVAMGLAAAGIALGFLAGQWTGATALALVGLVLLYNGYAKRFPVVGPINMGLCRGLSLLMGAATAGLWGLQQPLVVVSAVGLTLYVAAVTQIARRETKAGEVGAARWAPTAVLAAWFVGLQIAGPWESVTARMLSGIAGAFAAGWSARWAQSIAGTPEPGTVPRAIGGFLGGLLLVQAALVTAVVMPGVFVAAAMVMLVPVAAALGRKYAAS